MGLMNRRRLLVFHGRGTAREGGRFTRPQRVMKNKHPPPLRKEFIGEAAAQNRSSKSWHRGDLVHFSK